MKNSLRSRAEKAAESHSLDCFLNSLLQEWTDGAHWIRSVGKKEPDELRLSVGPTQEVSVPVFHHSGLGRHAFGTNLRLIDCGTSGETSCESDFVELVSSLVGNLERKLESSPRAVSRFRKRVAQSRSTIEGALTRREADLDRLYAPSLEFLRAEQGLVLGHAFHPTPKSRDEFSAADLEAYSPEYASRFPLVWWLVAPHLYHERRANSFPDTEWLIRIAREENPSDIELEAGLKSGLLPFPVHPWQRARLLEIPRIQRAIDEGSIREISRGSRDWHPTSSVRSLYRADARYMLKFSMTVRLTNSIRHLLAHEVARGPQLYDVLNTEIGKCFLAKHSAFGVLHEPAYVAIVDEDGIPLPSTIVVARENPFRGTPDSVERSDWAVLATLAQAAPYGVEGSLISRLVEVYRKSAGMDLGEACLAWLRTYLRVVVEPLLDAQANFGIVLGAHQQNLLLRFERGLPCAARFRDCQGTGYTEFGFTEFSAGVPSLERTNGNIVSARMGNALFIYYLFLNSTFQVVAALARTGSHSEETLLGEVRTFLETIRQAGVRDSGAIDTLLDDSHLLHKGNFLCSLRDLNENTTADPLAIYAPVANPLQNIGGVPR